MAAPLRTRARIRAGIVAVAILTLAVAAERERWFGRLRAAAAPARTWIWTSDPPRSTVPLAFLAARDFELERVPASARLSVIGDPEYLVWVNGERIGSGAYRADAPFDVYEVAPALRPGRNRIVLDLRSATGSGGASLRLADGAGVELAASDDRWHVYRREWPGLFRAAELWPTERAAVLGVSPLARWALPADGPLRPGFDEAQAGPAVGAVRFRRAGEGSWRPLRPGRRPKRPLGGRVEFDFGREVAGYLHLKTNDERSALALLRFSSRPGAGERWHPDAIAVPLAGRGYWQAPTPRRFRYVEVVGVPEVSWAAVVPIGDAAWRALAPEPSRDGLLGLRPDPVRLPIVDEIWKRWEAPPVLRAPRPRSSTGPRAREKAGAAGAKNGVEAGAPVRSDGAGRTPGRPRGRGGRHRPETS
jgi:hypothetical protein